MRITTRSRLSIAVWAGIALISLIAALWGVDSAIAARAEHRISHDVRNNAHLDQNPSVYLGGFPYVGALFSGKVPGLGVSVSDVEVNDFGLLTTSSQVTDMELNRSQLFSGDVEGTHAQLLTRTVGFDAVAVGKQLNILDLDLSNPYDVSPAGTNSSEVQLRGTPDGFSKPITVIATMRLEGPTFKLTPTTVVDRGESNLDDSALFRAFTWTLNTKTLPINAQASYVYLAGGSIRFEAQERNVTLRLEDLAPVRSASNKVVVD